MSFSFPDIEIEPAPTPEELDSFIREQVGIRTGSQYVDPYNIEGAPSELYYEWAPIDPQTENRYAALGFRRNDALAARSRFLNPNKEKGNMIMDVACYTIRKEKKQAMDYATEIAKQMRQDPRKSYSDVAKELGVDYSSLPEKEIAANKQEVLDGKSAKLAIMSDQAKS